MPISPIYLNRQLKAVEITLSYLWIVSNYIYTNLNIRASINPDIIHKPNNQLIAKLG